MFLWIAAALIFHLGGACAQCGASGRFANELAEQCRGYTTCISAGGAAASYQYDLVCPPGFLYNHLDSQCTNASSAAYGCLPAAQCDGRAPGPYPDPTAAECDSFVACVPGLAGLSARRVRCAPRSRFDPAQQFCVNSEQYACPPATPSQPAPEPAAAPGDPEVTTTHPNGSSFTTAASYFTYIVLFSFVFGASKL